MRKINKIMMLSFLLSFSSSSQTTDNYFSCNTVKGALSLKMNSKKLVYKMAGSNGEIFSYSSPGPSFNGFSYNHYTRFQTEYFRLNFKQGGFEYIIFSDHENGNRTRGVTVVRLKDNQEYTYNCKDEGVDNLVSLAMKLQCDTNSALGCQ